MYEESDIESAIRAGILTEETVAAFRAHVAEKRAAPAADEEHFRLVTGFNDIFVAIAGLLVLVGSGWIGGALAPWAGAALVAVVAWGLAEFFTRKRRMAFPSILFLLAFAGGVFMAVVLLLMPEGSVDDDPTGALVLSGAAAVTAIAARFHWQRFAVPITVAAGTAALAGLMLSLLLAAVPGAEQAMMGLLLIAGLCIFAFAMQWDMQDRMRTSRRADVAFWLHLLAAPMIVHPLFVMLGIMEGDNQIWKMLVVFFIYLSLAAVALIVDRRALMVSGLAYVLAALIELFRDFGAVSLNIALAAFVIGSALLLLSAFWHTARAALVSRLPDDVQKKLPPAG